MPTVSAAGGGYIAPIQPRRPPTLGQAAAGAASDPFGLASGRNSLFGPYGNTGSASAAFQGYSTVGPAKTGQAGSLNAPGVAGSGSGSTTTTYGPVPQMPTVAPSAAALPVYDINTDPAVQSADALAGLSDAQAQAAADQQRRDQILAYGDPNLANSVLNDPTLAKAAAGNPTSTVAQLAQQRDKNLKTLDDQLNSQNLAYSGYRVKQEQQAATDYQNALAQAAAGVNSNLGQITANLNGVLTDNQNKRVAAEQAAEQQAAQAAMQQAMSLQAQANAQAILDSNNALAQYLAGGGWASGGGGGGASSGGSSGGGGGSSSSSSPIAVNTGAGSNLGYAASAPAPNTPLALARAAAGRGAILF